MNMLPSQKPDWIFDANECSDAGLHAAADFETIVTRLKADLAYHQAEAARITRRHLDLAEATEGDDATESYHAGRVAALTDALALLHGREVKLYSETERHEQVQHEIRTGENLHTLDAWLAQEDPPERA